MHVNCFLVKLLVVLVSLHETRCTLILSFIKLILSWCFSSWNILHFFRETFCTLIYCSCNIMLIYLFVEPMTCWFISNLLYMVFFFMRNDACWFLFLKLGVCGLFLQGTSCILIYVFEKLLYFYFFFMKVVSC